MTRPDRPTRRAFLARSLAIGASFPFAQQWLAHPALGAQEPPKKSHWKIGCYTRPWGQYDYRVALDAIAEAGFRYAGLMTCKSDQGNLVISVHTTPEEARQIGLEVTKRGLKVPSVYGGGFPVGKSLEAGIAGLRRLVDHCAAAGSETLMVGGIGDAGLYDNYYKTIAEVCDYAAEKKVGLVLKPHGGRNATGPQCRRAAEQVGHKSFTLWYDPGNVFFYSDGKLDPVKDCATVAGLVTGMCIKDFTMSLDGGKLSKDVMLTPGTGRVDFPAVMTGLKQGGFTGGPLVIECLARGDLPATLAEAKKARQFVEELIA